MLKAAEHKQLVQTVANLALHAGFMIAKGSITVEDSAELLSSITSWAVEFEQLDPKSWPDEDYILAVEHFADQKLLEAYGTNPAG